MSSVRVAVAAWAPMLGRETVTLGKEDFWRSSVSGVK